MKNKYEGILVLNTTGLDENIDELVQKVGKEIEGEGASLEQIEQMGRKEFAYNARHLEGGHYVNYQFMAEADTLEKVRARMKLNPLIHLQHYQRV
jgi:small subunit ribosomal protein S6